MLSLREAVGVLESARADKLRIREQDGKKIAYDPCIMVAFNKCDSILVRSVEQTERRYEGVRPCKSNVSLQGCEVLPIFSVCHVCSEHTVNKFVSLKGSLQMWENLLTADNLHQLAYRYIVGLVLRDQILSTNEGTDPSVPAQVKQRKGRAAIADPFANKVVDEAFLADYRYHGRLCPD